MKLTPEEIKSIVREGILKADKGLGDTVSRAIKTVTGGLIEECRGCIERRNILNKKIPYKPFKP